jgi:putative FmdB family regulatory protein
MPVGTRARRAQSSRLSCPRSPRGRRDRRLLSTTRQSVREREAARSLRGRERQTPVDNATFRRDVGSGLARTGPLARWRYHRLPQPPRNHPTKSAFRMPLYEYHCRHCDRPFERYSRTFSEAAACPACGTSDVSRLLSTFAVSTNGGSSKAPASFDAGGACGEGPPCGAPHCGRLAN